METTRRRRPARWVWIGMGFLAGYLLLAYVILPQVGREETHRHPDLTDIEHLTHTADGIPGDPLNIALVGSEEDVIRSMHAAGWNPADPLTFRSSVRIAADTVFRRPDDDAPVSNLYLFGRKEDLAFEKPVGDSPRKRHHVRFWRTEKTDEGRPVWIGSAAFDIGVELSRRTGQVTHHISPDVDAERNLLVADLERAGHASEVRWIDGFHKVLQGRNGGGDPWHTDGRLAVVTLPESEPKQPAP